MTSLRSITCPFYLPLRHHWTQHAPSFPTLSGICVHLEFMTQLTTFRVTRSRSSSYRLKSNRQLVEVIVVKHIGQIVLTLDLLLISNFHRRLG